MKYIIKFICILPFLFFANCTDKEDLIFNNYNLNSGRTIYLNDDLKEISGLTVNKLGDILTHNDEQGIIYKVDSQGVVSEYIRLKNMPQADFEGIASADDIVYLVTSKGTIYEVNTFSEDYITYENSLFYNKEVEGLCYYKKNNSLLLACKEDMGIMKGIYEFNLDNKTLRQKPLFFINTADIRFKENRVKEFSPSGIEYNEITNTFFVISANEKAIVEIDENGKFIQVSELGDIHVQPEGITFLKDGTLVISDEGKDGDAFLTFFNKIK